MPIAEALLPFSGRWVVLADDQVAAEGVTAAEAEARAAEAGTPAGRAIFVPTPFAPALPTIVEVVGRAVPEPAKVWLIGGAVRDCLLHRSGHDFDFAVAGDGVAVARRVADVVGGAFYPLDSERGVGRVIMAATEADSPAVTLDFARLRGPDIYADLAGRDFTCNALAVPLADPEVCLDPLHGERDLRAKVLRLCSPSAIADDPVRGVRAVRQAAELGLRLDPDTRAAVRAAAPELKRVSPERQRDEFIRCLGGPQPEAALRALERLGLLDVIVPEALSLRGVTQSPPHVLDVWEHTLAVITRLAQIVALLGPVHDVDAASDIIVGLISVRLGRYRHLLSEHLRGPLSGDRPRRWLLMLAALLHDIAKPETRHVDLDGRIRFLTHERAGAERAAEIFSRLRFSADEVRYARTLVAHHMRPRQLAREGGPSARAVYRFFRDTDAVGVDIVLLSLADYLGKFGGSPPPQDEWAAQVNTAALLLEAYFEQHAVRIAPPALLSGDEVLAEFRLTPGPQIGRLLEALREAQATGQVGDRAQALEFLRRQLDGPGPTAA